MSLALDLSKKYKTLLSKAEVNTPLRLAHFFGQADHESGLKPVSESLNYASDKVQGVFGAHRISKEDAQKYGRNSKHPANQEAIANTVYGSTWGRNNLGNKVWGDGWKCRGRGIFQITGLSNYIALTKYAKEVLGLQVDYVKNPDLLLNEADSIIAAIWYWNMKGLSTYADEDNADAVSDLINIGKKTVKQGDAKGFADRQLKTNKYKIEFGV